MNLHGRKIQRFRCTVDPMIPPRPRNAFDNGPKGDHRGWEFEMTPAGVYVKAFVTLPGQRAPHAEEHVVPYSNIQSLKLAPEETKETPAAVDTKGTTTEAQGK